ncbi:MAG: N-acetylmuramic acid 6-phosphate etherase [Acidobacteria bacterium]|nr:N-acetylmuramic acid 6-phosphate etherase [Acidobacteriota bacterium]
MLDRLLTEQANPATRNLDALSTLDMMRALNAEDAKVAAAVAEVLPQIAAAVDGIAERVAAGGALFYLGAGTSGRLGVLDASEIPPTFGAPPNLVQGIIAGGPPALTRSIEGAEDDADGGERDLLACAFGPGDAVVGVAASGRTPYVLGGLQYARRIGALTIALSTNPDPLIGRYAAITIAPVVGPEAVAGSTRMKSGTAQKMVLNMLSTGLMVKRGAVYGNLMVNVQLRNRKLWERARRMVEELAGCDAETALAALRAGQDVRLAVLMVRRGWAVDEARRRLEAAGGVLRRALETTE